MRLIDIIQKLLGQSAGNVTALEALLRRIAAAAPDFADEANAWIAALGTAVTPENLAALGAAIPGELLNIVQGKLDPRPHAGDGV